MVPHKPMGLTDASGTVIPPDDIWSTDQDVPASGANYLLYVVVGSTSTLATFGALIQTGTWAGCTEPVTLNTDLRYLFVVQSAADVGDDTVQVLAGTDTPTLMSVATTLIPQYPLLPRPWDPIPTRDARVRAPMWSDILAAASKTLERFDPPGANTYTAYPWPMSTTVPGETDPTSTASSSSRNGEVFLAANHRNARYVIAHEFGHAIIHHVTGDGIPADDSYAVPGVCATSATSHNDGTVEYASKALSEGWADYVAATTWNRTDQTDCWYFGTRIDWDNDGVNDYFTDVIGTAPTSSTTMQSWQDCEGDGLGGGTSSPSYTAANSGGDFLTQVCGLEASSGLGNEMDWRRMFWDIRTEVGLSNATLLDIIQEAKSDETCWIEQNSIPSVCRPNARMAAAVATIEGNVAYNLWLGEAAYNGVEP